ncbi:Gfo/Idh/MocA family protein [Nocardioides pyridinolyticus]
MSATSREIGSAVIGFGWMGKAHTTAYARVPHHLTEVAVRPRLVLVADAVPGRAAEAAERFGFESATEDWHDVLTDPRVEAVSVTAPNFLHRELGTAVADAGKHLWIEKPVGLGLADAQAVADAVARADLTGVVGFNYRHSPAVEEARRLVTEGAVGDITHCRVRMFSDYAAHPAGALSWRYERERGGNGVLGDLASHGVDLIRFVLGEIESLVADSATFIPQRARPTGATRGHTLTAGGDPGPVENDDAVSALLHLTGGAHVTLEASRVAVGDQNAYGFEVHGTRGALAWDFRRMGELQVCLGDTFSDQPMATRYVGPGAGDYGLFQPGAGIAMGYDDLKVLEAARFLSTIVDGRPRAATLADAVASARALDAMEESVSKRAWVDLA